MSSSIFGNSPYVIVSNQLEYQVIFKRCTAKLANAF